MKWSNKETLFLRNFYKNTENSLLSEALEKSGSSVRHKALRMGLSKKRNNYSYTDNKNLKWSSYKALGFLK